MTHAARRFAHLLLLLAGVIGAAPVRANTPDIVLYAVFGNNQVQQRDERLPPLGGRASFNPLIVRLERLQNQGMVAAPNVRVRFRCTSQNPSLRCDINPAGGAEMEVVSDATGHAILKHMEGKSAHISGGVGQVFITARAVTPTSTLSEVYAGFALRVDPTPTSSVMNNWTIARISNADQAVGMQAVRTGQTREMKAVFAPLKVLVKTAQGAPVPNVWTTWHCYTPQGTVCQVAPTGHNIVKVMTDSQGVATLNQMEGGGSAVVTGGGGELTMVVGPDAAITSTRFALQARRLDDITIESEIAQSRAFPGRDLTVPLRFDPLVVRVTNGAGQPVAGKAIQFKCEPQSQRMTCQLQPNGQPMAIVVTDAQGLATLNLMGGAGAVVSGNYGIAQVAVSSSDGATAPGVFRLALGAVTKK